MRGNRKGYTFFLWPKYSLDTRFFRFIPGVELPPPPPRRLSSSFPSIVPADADWGLWLCYSPLTAHEAQGGGGGGGERETEEGEPGTAPAGRGEERRGFSHKRPSTFPFCLFLPQVHALLLAWTHPFCFCLIGSYHYKYADLNKWHYNLSIRNCAIKILQN